MRILVNAPSGEQQLIDLGPGGKYFDESRVLWDERKDGPLPEVTVGGMVRDGDALRFDESVAAARVVEKPAPRKVVNAEAILAALVKKGVLKEGDV